MTRTRSPELFAIPMVAAAVVWFGPPVLGRDGGTRLSWVLFALANVAIAVLVFALLLRRNRTQFPTGSQRRRAPRDGVYRLLVLADGGGAAAAIREQLARSRRGAVRRRS